MLFSGPANICKRGKNDYTNFQNENVLDLFCLMICPLSLPCNITECNKRDLGIYVNVLKVIPSQYEVELWSSMWAGADHGSFCQSENGTDNGDSDFKAATWPSCLCLMSHGTFKTISSPPQPTLLTEWQAQKGVHAPCVSALAEWVISVSSSLTAESELARRLGARLTKASVGTCQSVASQVWRPPLAWLTAVNPGHHSLASSALRHPASTCPGSFTHKNIEACAQKHTHPCSEPFTLGRK